MAIIFLKEIQNVIRQLKVSKKRREKRPKTAKTRYVNKHVWIMI